MGARKGRARVLQRMFACLIQSIVGPPAKGRPTIPLRVAMLPAPMPGGANRRYCSVLSTEAMPRLASGEPILT